MSTVQLREARASLSKLVAAAERGETTTITRNGKPVAVVAPVAPEDAPGEARPNLYEFLKTFPGGIDFERDPNEKLRDVDL